MPGKVYSLSTPMAALAVLGFNSASVLMDTPGQVIDPEFIQQVEDIARNAWDDSEGVLPGPEDPIWDFLLLCVAVLFLFAGILLLINWVAEGIAGFFKGQNNTTPPKGKPTVPPKGPQPAMPLTPAQQRLHNDVASRLAGTTYDSREIDELIRAGYLDPDAIAAIIRGGKGTFAAFDDPTIAKMMNALAPSVQLVMVEQAIANNYSKDQVQSVLESIATTQSVTASENKSFTYANSGQTVTAHTILEHVGKTDAYLRDRVSKGPAANGVQFASTFPDAATAQNGVDMVIAKSAKLQALIKAAVPGTAKTDKNCNPPTVYGRGFQKNVLALGPPPTYAQPTEYSNLHCVTVTIGIGPDGKPFIITAYPSN